MLTRDVVEWAMGDVLEDEYARPVAAAIWEYATGVFTRADLETQLGSRFGIPIPEVQRLLDIVKEYGEEFG